LNKFDVVFIIVHLLGIQLQCNYLPVKTKQLNMITQQIDIQLWFVFFRSGRIRRYNINWDAM